MRLRKKMSSRPSVPKALMELHDLTFVEIELIAALLYNTKLGHGVSPYRDAAYGLITKIDAYMNDDGFGELAAGNVGVQINVLDDNMYVIAALDNQHFEIEV